MELKWLEDFASIVETRSFSRSAQLRHVSQPAFSRRIRALEDWLGDQGVKNINAVNGAIKAAQPWKKKLGL